MILMINYSHKWWYKLITCLLILSLIVAISFGAAPRAKAVGVLTMTVCAAIIAVMAGAGIGTIVAGMTSSDIQSWLQDKLTAWDTYRNDGNTFTELINGNLITVTVKGFLAIGNAAARGISDFISWLKNDLSLQNNDSVSVVDSGGLDLSEYFNISVPGTASVSQNVITFNQTSYSSQAVAFTSKTANTTLIEYDISFNATKNSNAGNLYPTIAIRVNDPAAYSDMDNCYRDGNFLKATFTNGQSVGSAHVILQSSGFSVNYVYSRGTVTISNLLINDTQAGQPEQSLDLQTGVINIPDVTQDQDTDILIGISGVYPGANVDDATDVIMDGVVDNTLDTTMTVTSEYVDAIEAVIINEQPISVNTDHHMIGFSNLPDFQSLNLNSIWHYVSDAVEYASSWIVWFVNMMTSIPVLAIPLYMSFTLLIVLSFIRRILL